MQRCFSAPGATSAAAPTAQTSPSSVRISGLGIPKRGAGAPLWDMSFAQVATLQELRERSEHTREKLREKST